MKERIVEERELRKHLNEQLELNHICLADELERNRQQKEKTRQLEERIAELERENARLVKRLKRFYHASKGGLI